MHALVIVPPLADSALGFTDGCVVAGAADGAVGMADQCLRQHGPCDRLTGGSRTSPRDG
ncbi:hypothetical protein ABZV75_34805 [Streptomyces flaveolus]|uniref:hypothetical protein n=1 Tax=Streptomyces flaveolus TaxID=67297 RepID=UPI0033AA6A15